MLIVFLAGNKTIGVMIIYLMNSLRRRRGKNLIAAHNCRNRKLTEVEVSTLIVVCKVYLIQLFSVQELSAKVQEAKEKLCQSREKQKALLIEKKKLEDLLKYSLYAQNYC